MKEEFIEGIYKINTIIKNTKADDSVPYVKYYITCNYVIKLIKLLTKYYDKKNEYELNNYKIPIDVNRNMPGKLPIISNKEIKTFNNISNTIRLDGEYNNINISDLIIKLNKTNSDCNTIKNIINYNNIKNN